MKRHRVIPEDVGTLFQTIVGIMDERKMRQGACDRQAGAKMYLHKQARIICIPKTNSKEELAAIYTAADLFINPTHEDNYPTVNLEAVACGTKVITYDVGGARETVPEGR